MAISSGLPIKLVGTHPGVTLAADGPSQMALADVGFMRALAHTDDYRGNPGMTVLTPSDPVSAYNLVLAMAEHPTPAFLRAVRPALPSPSTATAPSPSPAPTPSPPPDPNL